MVDTIERSTPKSKADRSNIIETRYRSMTASRGMCMMQMHYFYEIRGRIASIARAF